MGSVLHKHTVVQMNDSESAQRFDPKMAQNILLIWLDSNIDQANTDCQHTLIHLKRVINTIHTFTNIDDCVQFLQKNQYDKICMIVSGSLGKQIIPHVHHMSYIAIIFIFCGNTQSNEQWVQDWPKIKGVHTDIKSICYTLQQFVKDCEHNGIGFSLVESDDISKNLNQLDPMFICTWILKDILFDIEFESEHFLGLIKYCREILEKDNKNELQNIAIFEQEYTKKTPIWWYTSEFFLYSLVNKTLYLLDISVIMKIGFFIRDLHQQIQCCHSKQCHKNQLITLYRGQYLLEEHFKQLCQTQGGLLTFNNFLSTTTEISKALWFVQHKRSGQVGIFFTITPHQLLSSTPFASIDKFSEHPTEKEVLFSMHTIFRIENVEFCPTNQIWKVELTQTTLNNHELYALTKCLGDTIAIERFAEYDRLGRFFIQMSKFDQAQHVYQKMLLDSKVKDFEKANIYHQLGRIQDKQGQQQQAIDSYIKCITILEKHNSKYANDLALAYNSMGALYTRMANYAEALTFYNKALTIQERNLHGNHLDIADTKNNIGILYKKTNDLRKAENYLNEALQIRERVGPACHPNIVQSYYNLSLLYEQMQDRDREIVCLDKAVSIGNQCLPKDHPFLQKINAKKRTYRA